jgi:hypothetical protein
MSGPAEIEACHERLHRAGWSIGEVGCPPFSLRGYLAAPWSTQVIVIVVTLPS